MNIRGDYNDDRSNEHVKRKVEKSYSLILIKINLKFKNLFCDSSDLI